MVSAREKVKRWTKRDIEYYKSCYLFFNSFLFRPYFFYFFIFWNYRMLKLLWNIRLVENAVP